MDVNPLKIAINFQNIKKMQNGVTEKPTLYLERKKFSQCYFVKIEIDELNSLM